MSSVVIKDFVFNTEHVFPKAVPFEEVGFSVFCEAMLRTFGAVLKTTDITLEAGDRLYNYRLSLRMFNGSADVILTSAGVTAAFRDGRSKAALQTVGTCVAGLERLLERFPVELRQAIFAAHAIFEKPDEYTSHMARFTEMKGGYTAGGLTLHCPAASFDGQLRFTTDKSFVYQHGIFATCQLTTAEKLSQELLGKLEARFTEISQDLQLNFTLPE